MITAKNKHISSKPVVTDLLTEVGNELCTGLVMFQAFTPSEFEPWAKKKKIDTNKVFARFFYRVCKALVCYKYLYLYICSSVLISYRTWSRQWLGICSAIF